MSLILLCSMDNHYGGGRDNVAEANLQDSEHWDNEQHLQAYLNDVPGDLSSQYYKYHPTYASLEDAIQSRRQDQVGLPPPELFEDSDQMSAASSLPPDHPPSVRQGAQEDQANGANGIDTSMLYPDSSALKRHSVSVDCLELATPSPTARSTEGSLSPNSGDFKANADPEHTSPLDEANGLDEPCPTMPPEPQLQPTLHDEVAANEPPKLVLDGPHLPMKHHIRARTFPLRTRPVSAQVADAADHGHAHGHHRHPNGHPHPHTHVHSMQDQDTHPPAKRTAPRFTGFDSLPAPNPSARPLHLQPHPGRVRPLPPAHPRPHFAPNPGPLALPLPRRASNPPPPVDPAKDAFYHELKSKLWKLAQELELRQPQRVTIPEDADLPSPDPEYDDNFDFDDEFDDCDDDDDECFPGENCENILRMSVRRRSSEGRGRKAARERAENARLRWLAGPD